MMDPTSTNISVKLGTVHEITGAYGTKAVVLFEHEGVTQRALLRCKNLVYDGILLSEDNPLHKFVPVGTEVYFKCYKATYADASSLAANEMCKYYIIVCWRREDIDFPKDPSVEVFHGMCQQPCYFAFHGENNKYGVAASKDDESILIKFFYHKVFIKGENFGETMRYKTTIEMQCDAIPTVTDPVDGTTWLSKILWRGKRPDIKDGVTEFTMQTDMKENIKQLTQNSRSIFMRTTGQIIKLLDKEYGVALAMIRTNEWHTVLFHSTGCFLNETSLAHINLQAVFQPGDKVNILAAKAPSQLPYQWVASHISVYKGPIISIS